MRIAIVAPTAWRTPHAHSAPAERVVSLLAEGLVERGDDVRVFPVSGCDVESGSVDELDPHTVDVHSCLEVAEAFESAAEFDVIHNHCGALPLTYAGLASRPVITTLYAAPSSRTLPVYRKRSIKTWYVAISDSVRSPDLTYAAVVYPAIDTTAIPFAESHDDYLASCCEIRPQNGVDHAVEIAARSGRRLVIAGPVRNREYFDARIAPHLDSSRITYVPDADPNARVRLLGKAAGLLCPLQGAGTFEMSCLEANACGTPVIAYPVAAMREIVTDGHNGFLVSDVAAAVDAVERLDTLSRREIRKAAEGRFSADTMVTAYRSLYAEMLRSTDTEDHRPWGYYQVLTDRDDHKVKRIVVYPGKRLSLQRHKLRSEHWTIVSGEPVVVVNDTEVPIRPGEAIEIPAGASHRIGNPGKEPVVFVEVQTGTYFGEDDIERFDDDFGRLERGAR